MTETKKEHRKKHRKAVHASVRNELEKRENRKNKCA